MFQPDTEAAQLLDGILSIGPDTNEAFLARLYSGLFNSAPDPSGICYAEQLLQTGTNQVQLASDFLASPQGQATFATSSDAQFIGQLFEGFLGRAPSASEQSTYAAAFAAGITRGPSYRALHPQRKPKASSPPTRGRVPGRGVGAVGK